MAAVAARAALVVAALAGGFVLLRRRVKLGPAEPAIAIVGRAPLAAGAGLALVHAGGRRLVVGWGKDGVRLVRDLGAAGSEP